ncbi:Endoglucanase 23 [Vitis vinifera]|uniref:cellulase n=1 Tax=Vitis vinifera TaxID=29760 RepID=A0A438DXE1_VITVI|nr:Endoglucanase 23 [Vitis vinifera]
MEMGGGKMIGVMMVMTMVVSVSSQDYGDALTKSILFFEGQRSGKLPSSQRVNWRKDSGVNDGKDVKVDLTGGYYDAGDNVKFNFPMAFTTTLLAWSVIEFGQFMDPELQNALDAVRWGTDYLLKATTTPGTVIALVGDPSVTIIAGKGLKTWTLLGPLMKSTLRLPVFDFADKNRGSYNDAIGRVVCPYYYCDGSGYMDELGWGAAWLYKATNDESYWNYVQYTINNLPKYIKVMDTDGTLSYRDNFAEFGWDTKVAGINVLVSGEKLDASPFVLDADRFVCTILPESPTKSVTYSPGGLLFKSGPSNMQHATTLSFLLVVYAGYSKGNGRQIQCGNVVVSPDRLVEVSKSQDKGELHFRKQSIGMSYMVGYGDKFPNRIHHRGSSLPSMEAHPDRIDCNGGTPYFQTQDPNPNLLTGAVVGGPAPDDSYADSRADVSQSEPATYINAPLVGLLAYFKANS